VTMNCKPYWFCCAQEPADIQREITSLREPVKIVPAKPWGQDHTERDGQGEDQESTDINGEDSGDTTEVDPWLKILSVSGDHPLLAALRLHGGHVPLLQQQLRKFAAGCDDLRGMSDLEVDQLKRIVAQHNKLFGPDSIEAIEWPVHDCSLAPACEYGARLVGDMVQWFRVIELEDSDIVKGFAAYLEMDLARYFADDLVYAESLGMHTARRDAAWRAAVRTRPYYIKEDNVWVHSALDALEEPLGALVIFAYTPPKPRLVGVPCVPATEHGFVRSEFDCTIHSFEPMLSEGAFSPTGFRLTQLGVSHSCHACPSESSKMAVQCIKDGTGDTLKFLGKLKRYLDTAHQLEARMRASPRTELYDRIYKHLDVLWPCIASA